MKKSYEELQDEALIGEGGNICDISIDRLRSPTMKKLHKSQCHDPKAGKERDSGMQRAAKKAGMSRANRMKLYNDVNEGESRVDALKRAMAVAKWKKRLYKMHLVRQENKYRMRELQQQKLEFKRN